jgi:hypothetical protein
MAVWVYLTGEVAGVVIADHKETPSWMDRVIQGGIMDALIGKTYTDAFEINNDLDGVTEAT